LTIISTAITIAFVCAQFHFSAKGASPNLRILHIKDRVQVEDNAVKLKDLVINKGILEDKELEYVILEVSSRKEKTLSLVDLAYLMQPHKTLLNANLRGPSYITIRQKKDSEYIEKARKQICDYIKATAPWKDWDVDILINSSDELMIAKAGDFDKVEVRPNENKAMLGTVGFRVTFRDKEGKQIDKISISPVILRKVDVVVIGNSCKKGHRIKKSDLKKVPMWVGGNTKDYIIDEKECIGKELARSMSDGDIVKPNDILMPICAKRGDIIWVEYVSQSLTVRIAATVLESGRKGDFIRVKNNASQKIIEVELVDEKQAIRKI
jgi:flagella basal body P-ring formation protein FlgA